MNKVSRRLSESLARGIDAHRAETRHPGTGSKGLGAREPGPATPDVPQRRAIIRRGLFTQCRRPRILFPREEELVRIGPSRLLKKSDVR